jgi:RimJ/RimL family protein N-acetyltransferase
MIETARLILRDWREADLEPYADIMVEPDVGEWLGGPFTREQARERVARFRAGIAGAGFGRLAIERKDDGALSGHCGLAPTAADQPMPQGLEIGWALAPRTWGSGYATEAARAVIDDGFARSDAPEVLAFTGTTNLRSQGVMQRLGMLQMPERDFDHPLLAADHPLRRHVVFAALRP